FKNHYLSGLELFRAEQFLAAQKEFEKAQENLRLQNEIFAEEVEYYLAACAAANGNADAEQRLTAFLEKYPHTLYQTDIRLTLGNRYQADGRYAQALEQYAQVDPAGLAPAGRSEFYFNRAYAYFANREYASALRDFNLVGNDRVYGASATYYKAYIDYEQEQPESARRGFESLASNRQYGPIIPFYLLHIDFKSRNYRAVVDNGPAVLQSAAGVRKAETLRVIGESWYHLENYPEALRYLETYAAEHPDLSREEQYMIGYAAYMTGDFARAVNHLGKVAVGEDLLAQNASFHIGSASLRMGDKQRAKQAFSLTMRLNEDRAVQEEAMFNYAKLEAELGGMFNQSIETINAFLSEFPDSPHLDEARAYLMAAYLNNKNYAAAYDAVVNIQNPDNETKAALQKIAYFRGLEFYMDGEYEKAREMFDVAAANRYSAKYTALTNFWQAEVYYRQGQYLRAIPLYQDFIVLSPKGDRENILAHYNLAYCYFNQKNLREAKTWFDRFLAIHPENDELKADTYNRLGDIDYMNRNFAGAIKNYETAISVGSSEADYSRFQRALALGLSSGSADKINALQQIVNSDTSEYADAAMYELGSTYRKQEQFTQASSTLKSFVQRYPDSPYYLNALIDLGLISQNLGQNNEAMNYYKQVVEHYPNSSQAKDAMLGIQNLYVDANDPQGYFAYAERAGMETNVSAIERDSLTFHVAERIHLGEDARRSLPLMQTYLSQFPNGNYVANATYYIADSQMQLGETEAALAGFEKVVDMKFSPFTLVSLQKAATLNFQRENYHQAAGQYRRLSELATVRGTVEQALLGYIRSMDKLEQPHETIMAANYVLGSAFAGEEVKLETQYALGRAYLAQGDREQALDAFRKSAANIKTRNGSESQYWVVQLLFDQGNIDEAEAEIFKFSDHNTSHQYWLGRSFL
ncbi:MAG: tetratricopeptide repeat protein, partial [Rikenellaceae bacterium]|nr:tetratricopeptide repeat protein [Rikenellaceae bacterium]